MNGAEALADDLECIDELFRALVEDYGDDQDSMSTVLVFFAGWIGEIYNLVTANVDAQGCDGGTLN
jgi:hypothetical protein